MGSPVSLTVCNAYMEHIKQIAITSAPHPPLWWYRYVDDTHCKLNREHAREFTDHLNSIDPEIQFMVESENNGALAFLDTNTIRRDGSSLKITIYRKPTYTDQYLHWQSNHPAQHKLSVVASLHRLVLVV